MSDLDKLVIPEYIKRQLKNPEWEMANKVHDWRNYVELLLRENWKHFSMREKLIIYTMANSVANNEEWD